jgi:hypothetical protein
MVQGSGKKSVSQRMKSVKEAIRKLTAAPVAGTQAQPAAPEAKEADPGVGTQTPRKTRDARHSQ